MIVEMFSRPGCHLCEEAKELILKFGVTHAFTFIERNIDDDPAWQRLYGNDIPVVLVNGRMAFKHRVERASFLRYLERSQV